MKRVCPHCGKQIPKLPEKPRDLGLLLHCLTYRVPVEEEITERWIETARKHCKMKPERLVQLRAPPHDRHWRYLEEKRARRREWAKEHGEPVPFGWTPPAPGEKECPARVAALRTYRKHVAKVKARIRRNPEREIEKLLNRYLTGDRRLRSHASRLEHLEDIEARILMAMKVERERVSLAEFEALRAGMAPDDRFRTKGRRRAR